MLRSSRASPLGREVTIGLAWCLASARSEPCSAPCPWEGGCHPESAVAPSGGPLSPGSDTAMRRWFLCSEQGLSHKAKQPARPAGPTRAGPFTPAPCAQSGTFPHTSPAPTGTTVPLPQQHPGQVVPEPNGFQLSLGFGESQRALASPEGVPSCGLRGPSAGPVGKQHRPGEGGAGSWLGVCSSPFWNHRC